MDIFHKGFMAAKELRKRQTKAEKVFWDKVKNRQFYGLKFRRQHPLFYRTFYGTRFFIADFYCKEQNLVVEIDGGIHEQQTEYDKHRSNILSEQKDLRIIRFKNEQVLMFINLVLEELAVFLGVKD